MIAYSKPPSDKYKDNFDKIFNKSKKKKDERMDKHDVAKKTRTSVK